MLLHQHAARPLPGEEVERLQIGDGVVNAAPGGSVEAYIPAAAFKGEAQRRHHVRIVLFRGQAHHFAAVGRFAQGVKIAHHDVRTRVQAGKRPLPAVGSDHQIARFGRPAPRAKIPRAHDPAAPLHAPHLHAAMIPARNAKVKALFASFRRLCR